MSDDRKVKIIIEQRGEANLRKLARALIALAQRQFEAEADGSSTDTSAESSS